MIAAIIVLYCPEISRLLDNICLLKAANWPVIVVDNSPQSHGECFTEDIVYHHFSRNVGIAAAQNCGVELAKDLGVNSVMLLDQDSKLTHSFLSHSASRFKQAQSLLPRLAALGPAIVSEFNQQQVTAKIQRPEQLQEGFQRNKQIIASGMIIPIAQFQAVGPMEEDLFIDGVDHEWCWRAIAKGYSIYQDTTNPLIHRQGEGRYRFMGVNFKIGHPIRLFYQFRNLLILIRRPYVPAYWKMRNIFALPVRFLVNLMLLEQGKLRKRYMVQGLMKGIRLKAGPYSAD